MKTPPNNVIKRVSILIMGGAVAVTLAVAAAGTKKQHGSASRPPEVNVTVDERPLPRDATLGTGFAPIVKKVAPSVVKIYTTTKVRQTSFREFPGSDDPFFRRFFGDEFGDP